MILSTLHTINKIVQASKQVIHQQWSINYIQTRYGGGQERGNDFTDKLASTTL